jgi:hypothetical protein
VWRERGGVWERGEDREGCWEGEEMEGGRGEEYIERG